MSSLEDAKRKIDERRQQQAQNYSNTDLWFRENDIVVSHFLCTGGENDPYFETYVAHEYAAKVQGGWPTLKYCPVESGHDQNYDCDGCRNDIKTKDRMIMWFWVYDILHSTLKQGENLPQMNYNNKMYFRREVNGPKIWDTSAWVQSPLDDILMLGAQLGNLQNMMMNLITTGSNLTKRFKIYTVPNTGPIDPQLVATAQQNIRPVIEILREKLETVPTAENPSMVQQPQPQQNNAPTPIQNYVPGGSASVPSYTPPTNVAPTLPPAKPKGGKGKNLF